MRVSKRGVLGNPIWGAVTKEDELDLGLVFAAATEPSAERREPASQEPGALDRPSQGFTHGLLWLSYRPESCH